MNTQQLTTEEQERAAYLAGDTRTAELLAQIAELEAERDKLEAERDKLEAADLRRAISQALALLAVGDVDMAQCVLNEVIQ